MISLLVEGFRSALLPCSLVLIVPGTAAVLAARGRTFAMASVFAVAAIVTAWLRFAGRAADWPPWISALGLAAGALMLVVADDGRRAAVAHGIAAAVIGAATAELWEPCRGEALDPLLAGLAERGPAGGLELALYVLAAVSPVAAVAIALRLVPERLDEVARSSLALVGGTALSVFAIAVAAGYHDEVTAQLSRWSS